MKQLVTFFALASAVLAIEYPSSPQVPAIGEPTVENTETNTAKGDKKRAPAKPVLTTALRIKIHLGDRSYMLAQAALPASYSFTHKKGQVQYQQTVRAEDLRDLTIESYRAHKVAGEKDGEVYEFEPASVRLELKDGQSFRLPYLFKDLRKLRAKNEDGSFSVFAFFADTYRKKSGWQERSGEPFVLSTRTPHPAAYTRIEYFEPVEKAGTDK